MSQNTVPERLVSRRRFLQVAGATGVGLISSGTGGYAIAQTPVAIESFSQAPSLDALDLPPVAERVPTNPMVIAPVDRIGEYGGTWRSALVGGSDTSWLLRTIGYEHLMRWDPEWEAVIPNIAESVEASDDAREYTFTLRAGMKWSDGAPFTADDILFYVNDVYRNPELTPSLGTNPFTAEKIDDTTVTIRFEQPNGLFLQLLATPDGASWTRYPKHYLQEFHATWNTENLDQLVADAGAANWVELFQTRGGGISGTSYDARWGNPELPTLHAWQIVEPYGEGTRVVTRRNPYYWKVDPEGNQLPYIDEVIFEVMQDPEVLLLRASNGEIDIHDRHFNTNINKPVLADNSEKGDYRFFETVPARMNMVSVSLNLTHPDPVVREIFQNKDFRIGLSHAINRQEIIDVVFVSQGEPWQLAPRSEVAFFNEALARQYTEYDVDLANQHLDTVLPEKDSAGFRLKPDGERVTIIVDVSTTETVHVDSTTLIVENWRAVGIDAQVNPVDRSLKDVRMASNEHDCTIWYGDSGLRDAVLSPRAYMPLDGECEFAPAWGVWYQNPADQQTAPVEPPEPVKRQLELYDELRRTAGEEQQTALFEEVLAIAQEQFYAIGICLPTLGYGIVKNNVVNVPASMPEGWLYPTPAPSNPSLYAFTGESKG